jgi:hypothetical protein
MTIILGVLGLLVVAVLAAEFGLRWADGIPLFVWRNFVHERVDLLKVNSFLDYDPLLGWVPSPHVRAGSGGETLTTDEHGTRQPSSEVRPLPLGAVLVSGDSFTIGAEVTDGDTWPAILERLIGRPVINAACGGWGADQIVLRTEQLLSVARPSTAVISFLWHDIQRAEYRIYGGSHKPYYLVKDGVLEAHNNPVPHFRGSRDEVGWARANFGWSYLVLCAAKQAKFMKWTNSWDLQYRLAMPAGAGIEVCCKLLARLKATADQSGFRLIFVMQYGSNDFDVDRPHEMAAEVVACARTIGIDTVDPWVRIKRQFDADQTGFRRLWVLQADGRTLGHMSPSGNQLIAEEIAAVFRA